MNRLTRIAVAAGLTATAAFAFAQGGPPTPEAQARSAIEARQAVFRLITQQNGPAGAMQRNQREFDAALVARNAERIQVLAGMIPELFTPDHTAVKTVKTAALDGIWKSQPDFKAKADALATAAAGVAQAAKTGDKAATMKAQAEVGKACGACHDNFRAKP